jgi:hypothetical protein
MCFSRAHRPRTQPLTRMDTINLQVITYGSSQTESPKTEDFMDEEDLAELRDSQTLVLQNEEVDIAGRYAGDLASRSLDVDNEQECVRPILDHSSYIYRSSMSLALEKALLPTPKDSPARKS